MILTRTVNLSAGSLRTTQTTVTGPDTKVQPRHLTLAPVETTPTEVSPECLVYMHIGIQAMTDYMSLFCLNLSTEGFYIYHECDNVPNGQKVRLLSPAITSSASHICVQFRYYMYGADDQNVLRVLAQRPGGETEVWKRTGIQSPSWLKGSVTVSKRSSQAPTVSVRRSLWMLL